MPAVDELTIEGCRQIYSDFHKDAYGFRPRHDYSNWTLEQWQEVWADLTRVCEYNRIHEAEQEARAIKDFEEAVVKLIAKGAKDRAAVIRWMHDAEQTGGDDEYLCFSLGLPYGYFSGKNLG
jgi:hypothetical protein